MARLSVTLPQFRTEAAPMLDAARRAEALGFDGVYVFDHLFPLGSPDRPIFEVFVALGAVAAATSTIVAMSRSTRTGWTRDQGNESACSITGRCLIAAAA